MRKTWYVQLAFSLTRQLTRQTQRHSGIIPRDYSFDDAVYYKVEVLKALGPDHALFEEGCVDLLTVLIDAKMIGATLRAVEHAYGRQGDAVSVGKIMSLFTSAAANVLARTGLGSIPVEASALKQPNA